MSQCGHQPNEKMCDTLIEWRRDRDAWRKAATDAQRQVQDSRRFIAALCLQSGGSLRLTKDEMLAVDESMELVSMPDISGALTVYVRKVTT